MTQLVVPKLEHSIRLCHCSTLEYVIISRKRILVVGCSFQQRPCKVLPSCGQGLRYRLRRTGQRDHEMYATCEMKCDRMDPVITCSEKGTEPSTALVATFPAMVFASVSRMMLQKYIRPKMFQYMPNRQQSLAG